MLHVFQYKMESIILTFGPFSAQLTKAYQTAAVLFEVLKAVNLTQSIEVDHEVNTDHFPFVFPFFIFVCVCVCVCVCESVLQMAGMF